MSQTLRLLPGRYVVCRFSPETIPTLPQSGFYSITRTFEELSVVCLEAEAPLDARCENDWRILQVEGPLDFSLKGILVSIAEPLAKADISIFAVSTFDTDYVMVKEACIETALRALIAAGHDIRSTGDGIAS